MANEDPGYLAWVRSQRCCAPGGGCRGPIQAHHAGRSGMGQRAHDETAIPLCLVHHHDWHAMAGVFSTMKREERREWSLARIAETRARHEGMGNNGIKCEAIVW